MPAHDQQPERHSVRLLGTGRPAAVEINVIGPGGFTMSIPVGEFPVEQFQLERAGTDERPVFRLTLRVASAI